MWYCWSVYVASTGILQRFSQKTSWALTHGLLIVYYRIYCIFRKKVDQTTDLNIMGLVYRSSQNNASSTQRRTIRSDTIFGNWKPFKNGENAFYFTSKALFVLNIFKFLSWLFDHVEKRLDKNDKFNFKFYDVTGWFKNNRNAHIAQYFEKII